MIRSLTLVTPALRRDPRAAEAFLTVLAHGQRPYRVLSIMNETGLLGRFLPEWGRIVGQTQFNMYHAYTVDEHTLQVGEERVTAERIVIAVGGRPIRPDLPGIDCVMISDDLFTLEKRPEKIIIVGGGYIGVEFAGLLHALGSEVVLTYRQKWPLRGFDQELREGLAEALTIAVNGLMEDGSYAKVLARWGLEAEALDRSQTNPPGLPRF